MQEDYAIERAKLNQLEERNASNFKNFTAYTEKLGDLILAKNETIQTLNTKLKSKDANYEDALKNLNSKFMAERAEYQRGMRQEKYAAEIKIAQLRQQNKRLEEAFEDYERKLEEKEQAIHGSSDKIRELNEAVATQMALQRDYNELQVDAAKITKDKLELQTTLENLKQRCNEETEVLGTEVNQLAKLLDDQREENQQLVRQLGKASEQGVGELAAGPGRFDYPRLLSTANKENSELSKQNQDLIDDVNALQAKLEILKRRETDLKTFYAAVKDVRDVQELIDVYSERFPKSKANFVGGHLPNDVEVYFDASNGQ